MGMIMQLMPLVIIQAIHAIVIYLCEKRWKKNPWPAVVLAVIPLFGMIYIAIYYATTLLRLIERVQHLTEQSAPRTFD